MKFSSIIYAFCVLGMVGVGGLFIMGGGYLPGTFPQVLGALSVLLAFVNVSGGFVITKRMLDMFKRKFQWNSQPLVSGADMFLQVQTILLNIRGSMPSRASCSVWDISRLRALVWLVSSRPDTWLAACSASVSIHIPNSLHFASANRLQQVPYPASRRS
jgi:hypothetical protein